MVSKAREDLPLPESPVTTTITSRGRETVMSFRLCSRAPRTTIWLSAISSLPSFRDASGKYTAPCWEPKEAVCYGERFYHQESAPLYARLRFSVLGPKMIRAGYTMLRTEPALILKDFSRILLEELEADCPLPGDATRRVRGLAVDEPIKGWISPDELAVTTRQTLDEDFLEGVASAGSPAVVWRLEGGAQPEVVERVAALGLGLFLLAPEVPLSRLFEIFSQDDGLLLLSHGAGRSLLESTGGETKVEELADRISDLLGRSVVIEDPVGRLIASSGDAPEENRLYATLEEEGLRASKSTSVDETRRERRDRYARLPDSYLSVPVERWRVAEGELFWTPIGTGAPAGYLWLDLEGGNLRPEDVVLLYWARRILEAELGKQRIRLETELGVRGDFVDDLVSGHYGSVELLLQRARYLGADLAEGALVMVVDIDDFARYLARRRPKEPAIQELKRRLAD